MTECDILHLCINDIQLVINSSPHGQNVGHFGIRISLKYVPRGPIYNKTTSVLVMAWRRAGDTPVTWSNADQVHWCIYAALGGHEFKIRPWIDIVNHTLPLFFTDQYIFRLPTLLHIYIICRGLIVCALIYILKDNVTCVRNHKMALAPVKQSWEVLVNV